MKRSGFTLVELLVTIGVIILLASLILTGLNVARARANSLRARNDINQIVTAWNAYLSDYRIPPSDMTETGPEFARLMRGGNPQDNPRRLTYMDFHEDSQGMVDPWGNRYQYAFAGTDGVARPPHGNIRAPVAVWSMGPDGSSEMPEDRIDDVYSWRDAD